MSPLIKLEVNIVCDQAAMKEILVATVWSKISLVYCSLDDTYMDELC